MMLSSSQFMLHRTTPESDGPGSEDHHQRFQVEEEVGTSENTIKERQRQATENMQFNRHSTKSGHGNGNQTAGLNIAGEEPGPEARATSAIGQSEHFGPRPQSQVNISTPSMRRADLVSVGRSHAHQNLVQNTEFTLAYETLILLYLTFCVYAFEVGPEFKTSRALNPRLHTMHFIMFVMWPTVLARLLIYFNFRNASYVRMQNCLFFLNAFYNVAYGVWTIYNIIMITQLPHDGKGSNHSKTTILELNYEIAIIFGVFPALITLFFLTVGLLCAPYIFFVIYQNRQHENSRLNSTRNMVARLFRTKYDANVFVTQESCMICLVNFDEESMVTPLPCDIRHYFHTACIEEWLIINARCPLCKSPVTLEEIERVAQLYQGKLEQHEKCCSEKSGSFSQKQEGQRYASSSYRSGSESKECPSHYQVGSHFYDQTLLSYNSNGTNQSFRSIGNGAKAHIPRQPHELEMSLQHPSRQDILINRARHEASQEDCKNARDQRSQSTAIKSPKEERKMPIRRQMTYGR